MQNRSHGDAQQYALQQGDNIAGKMYVAFTILTEDPARITAASLRRGIGNAVNMLRAEQGLTYMAPNGNFEHEIRFLSKVSSTYTRTMTLSEMKRH